MDTVLNGRYRLQAEIGRGGMGVVYRAHDTLLDRAVAVKVLSPKAGGSAGRARLLHEARAAAQLNHPNIVAVHDAGEVDSTPFIVMELIDGQSLDVRRPQGPDEILAIIRQVCAALDHAHAHGIVHRDLKPENILIAAGGRVKLTDFGLARSAASRFTAEGAVIGTVFYLSPEQIMGREVDGRTDLYALGVMLYELLTGRLPFTADDALAVISQHLYSPAVPPSTYTDTIAPALEALILQLLSKEPSDRPPSAAVVGEALDRLAKDAGRLTPIPGVQAAAPSSPLDQLVRGRLVAREREVGVARSVWRQAVAGFDSTPAAAPQRQECVLLVAGESGVGKTPLVRELTALARMSGGRALAGECYAEGGAPYGPLGQIIRQALVEQAPGPALPDLVLADLITLVPDLQALYPHVAPNARLDPAAEQQRLFDSLVALCAALVATAPLLLAVENVHWADGGTLLCLRHLARRARQGAGLRLLLVLTFSDVEADLACCLGDVLFDLDRERLAVRLKLLPYSQEQTGRVLATMFQEEMPPDLVDDVFAQTEGNLFYIEEICRALVETGQVVRDGGHWRRAGDGQVQLPQSIRAAVHARVARLTAEAQDVLRLAAVIGPEFDFQTLRLAGEWEEERLIEALEEAERAQIVAGVNAGSGETFAFVHGLISRALRDGIGTLRRHRLHRRVAAAVKAQHADDYATLAYHYAQAGDEAQAIACYTSAGQRAAAVFANEDAIKFYSAALDLEPRDPAARFDLLKARVRVFDLVGRRPQQRADAEAMLALAGELGDEARRCDALLALTDFFTATEFSRARGPAEHAAAIAGVLGDPVREAQALRRLGWAAYQLRDHDESRRALEAAVELFRRAGRPGQAAACLHTLSLVLSIQGLGRLEESQRAAEEAVALSRQAGDRRQEAWALRRLSITYMDRCRYAEALPYAEQALALHQALGDREAECHGLNGVGLTLAYLGRRDEAGDYFRRSIHVAEAIRSSLGEQIAVENMMELYYRCRGEFEAGLAFLDGHLAHMRSHEDEFATASLQARRAETLAVLGCYAAAIDEMKRSLEVADRLGSRPMQARALAFIGRMHAELGDPGAARLWLDEALARVDGQAGALYTDVAAVLAVQAYAACLEGGEAALRRALELADRALALVEGDAWKFLRVEVLQIAAQAHFLLNDTQSALAELAQVRPVRAIMPITYEAYLLLSAQILRSAGEEAESRAFLRQAYERVIEVAAKFQDESLRQSWLENVPANRTILKEWRMAGRKD